MGNKVSASSLRPWVLYHSDGNHLHSQPWDIFLDKSNESDWQRFFIRIAFYKKRPILG
jgi:hypothetical protein